MSFNAEHYWASRPVKKFVVALRDGDEHQNMIVAAPNEARARAAALEHTFLATEYAVITEVRLATPTDLGIEPVPEHVTLVDREYARYQRLASSHGLILWQGNGGPGERHLLLGSATAIAALENSRRRERQLSEALCDCLALMVLCQSDEWPGDGAADPVDTEEWAQAVRTAGQLLKGGK